MELEASALDMILGVQGWTLRPENYQGTFHPDFYEDGIIIANSRRQILVCRGISEFFIKGNKFNSIHNAITEHGSGILNSIKEWDWKEAKEWTVLGLNGKWVNSFTLITECPKGR